MIIITEPTWSEGKSWIYSTRTTWTETTCKLKWKGADWRRGKDSRSKDIKPKMELHLLRYWWGGQRALPKESSSCYWIKSAFTRTKKVGFYAVHRLGRKKLCRGWDLARQAEEGAKAGRSSSNPNPLSRDLPVDRVIISDDVFPNVREERRRFVISALKKIKQDERGKSHKEVVRLWGGVYGGGVKQQRRTILAHVIS